MKRRPSAIDTNVLLHAVGVRRLGVSSESHQRAQACNQLLEELEDVSVPAPVLTEAMRSAEAAEKEEILGRLARMRVLAVTPPAAFLAAKLLAHGRHDEKACQSCFNQLGEKVCKGCQRLVGKSTQLADALIAACVATQAGDWTLYTYDGHFERLMQSFPAVTVTKPPPYASSVPLLDIMQAASDEDEKDAQPRRDPTKA